MAKNENCVVTDTSLCKWIDKDCDKCYIDNMKHDDDRSDALTGFEAMLELLPEDFDSLSDEKCSFCRRDPKRRAGYALIDFGHKDPESKRGMFFGLGRKVRRRIGSMIPLNISICRECRSALRMYDAIKWLTIVAFIALGIAAVSIPSLNVGFNTTASWLPYIIIVGSGILGYLGSKLFAKLFIKSKSKDMYVNVFDIPVCAQMEESGWFLVQENADITRYIFTKKPMIRKIGDLKQMVKEKDEDFSQTSFLED